MTLLQFIEKANIIHNNTYDYSQTNYINSSTRIKIICNKHGVFEQTPNNHLRGQNCPKCVLMKSKLPRITFEEFVSKARKIFGDKYNYNSSSFKNMGTEITINCPIHGEFKMTPSVHIAGHGCKQCGLDSSKLKQRDTTLHFIEKAKCIFGDTYEYIKVNYVNSKIPVTIICKKHGDFELTPNAHLNGQGCRQCSIIENANKKRKTIDTFLYQVNLIYENKFTYPNLNYVNNTTPIEVVCSIHGSFWKRPIDHIRGQGCPKCSYSKGEEVIINWLDKNGIEYEPQKQFKDLRCEKPLRYDFYIPSKNLLVEYNGIQHYKYFKYFHRTEQGFHYQKHRDWMKRKYARTHNFKLLVITYKSLNNIEEILKGVIDG